MSLEHQCISMPIAKHTGDSKVVCWVYFWTSLNGLDKFFFSLCSSVSSKLRGLNDLSGPLTFVILHPYACILAGFCHTSFHTSPAGISAHPHAVSSMVISPCCSFAETFPNQTSLGQRPNFWAWHRRAFRLWPLRSTHLSSNFPHMTLLSPKTSWNTYSSLHVPINLFLF